MRSLIRALLPRSLVRVLGSALIRRRARRLSNMSVGEAFDEIYKKKLWQQGNSLSGCGSEGKWAKDYVAFVRDYVREHDLRVLLDVGCGDFAIGSQLSVGVDRYIAVDVSNTIIEENRRKYGARDNVNFAVLNVIEDDLPACDLLLVRQVFQHLSNDQIEKALRNIEKSQAARVLITEHIYRPELMSTANVELGSHSVGTRVAEKSGVHIGAPPFSRPWRILATFEPGPENNAEPNSVLCVYELLKSAD